MGKRYRNRSARQQGEDIGNAIADLLSPIGAALRWGWRKMRGLVRK